MLFRLLLYNKALTLMHHHGTCMIDQHNVEQNFEVEG